MSGRHPSIPMPAELASNPAWAVAKRFFTEWGEPGSLLHEDANHVYLEFDVAGANGAIPAPNMFFSPRFGNMVGGSLPDLGAVRTAARSLVGHGVELMAGGPLPATTIDAIDRCFSSLPHDSWLYEIGVMQARDPAPVRLQFSNIAPKAFQDLLARIGWEGSSEQLALLCDQILDVADDVTFALDVDRGIGPKIGLECYVRDTARWARLLDWLVDRDLCLPARRHALLAWMEPVTEHTADTAWPANLRRATSLFSNGLTPVIERYINHIKIVFIEDRAIEAKAYPAASLRWRAPVS